ncbi:MAG: hypothetical protein R2838_00175 [Caldilineaceae bacterium]
MSDSAAWFVTATMRSPKASSNCCDACDVVIIPPKRDQKPDDLAFSRRPVVHNASVKSLPVRALRAVA